MVQNTSKKCFVDTANFFFQKLSLIFNIFNASLLNSATFSLKKASGEQYR